MADSATLVIGQIANFLGVQSLISNGQTTLYHALPSSLVHKSMKNPISGVILSCWDSSTISTGQIPNVPISPCGLRRASINSRSQRPAPDLPLSKPGQVDWSATEAMNIGDTAKASQPWCHSHGGSPSSLEELQWKI